MIEDIKYPKASEPVSDEAMEKLARIMLDSPTLLKLKGTEWEITSLKPGTTWMISQEAAKASIAEQACFGDILKELSTDIPAVCRILALALLNDKDKIATSYDKVYDMLLWECEVKEWGQILFEVLNLIDIEVFFCITERIQMFKQISLQRKTTAAEQGR